MPTVQPQLDAWVTSGPDVADLTFQLDDGLHPTPRTVQASVTIAPVLAAVTDQIDFAEEGEVVFAMDVIRDPVTGQFYGKVIRRRGSSWRTE